MPILLIGIVAETAEQTNFVFMKLPAEIRLMIYEFLLIPDPSGGSTSDPRRMGVINLPVTHGPGILLPSLEILATCRTIKQEALRILYGRHCLAFPPSILELNGLVRVDLTVEHDHDLRSGRKMKINGTSGPNLMYPHVVRRFPIIRVVIDLKWFVCDNWGLHRPHMHLDVRGARNVGLLLRALETDLRKANRGAGTIELLFTSTIEESAAGLYRPSDVHSMLPTALRSLHIARWCHRLQRLRTLIFKKNDQLPNHVVHELTTWFENSNVKIRSE